MKKKIITAAQKISQHPLVARISKLPVWLQTLGLVVVDALLYLYRGNPFFFTPQLFAEDGTVWLAQGYNKDIWAIFQPVNGFLHTPERLFGFLVARFPLQWAPFIFVCTAWLLYIFTAYYLLSRRTHIVSNLYQRLFLTVSLGLVSNFGMFFFNFSNSAFLMGIIGLLIMVAAPARYKLVRVLEKAFFFSTCFTLTFAWFFLPIALFERFKYKRKNNFFLITSIVASIVQFCFFLSTHVNRSPVTLTSLYSKYTMLEIYNQMVVPALRFARIDTPVDLFTTSIYSVYTVYFTIIALLIAGYFGLRKSHKRVWYLLFFLVAMSFASLKSPTITASTPTDAIKLMSTVTGADRYFIYGILAVTIIFIKSSYAIITPKARYAFLVAITAAGLVSSVGYHNFFIVKGDYTDYSAQYRRQITLFNTGKVNRVMILQNPISWSFPLDRK